jgi:hypothetical protein
MPISAFRAHSIRAMSVSDTGEDVDHSFRVPLRETADRQVFVANGYARPFQRLGATRLDQMARKLVTMYLQVCRTRTLSGVLSLASTYLTSGSFLSEYRCPIYYRFFVLIVIAISTVGTSKRSQICPSSLANRCRLSVQIQRA